ncbi:hypothetical protein PUN28_002232 [Cardiocondyla obscurior]|uniref:Myb/SANT-like DNA-binding domain-containing protein n=1 Tax=Cardiocondyla obscurior TaxID=286306 RepID=A0AAW2GSY9_9HYME
MPELNIVDENEREYIFELNEEEINRIISQKVKEKSYNITGGQCKSKFNGLKKTYKNIKDHNNKNGNNKRNWSHFEVKL